ncbi:MAG: AAA domain-containing protein [Roseiflexus sp.]|nr:AAA domain-containing protein [Roseiflexus sp.]
MKRISALIVDKPETSVSFDHPGSPAEFLRRLRRLVIDEAESVRQQLLQIWSKPVAVRVAEGYAIEGVQIVRVTPEGSVELACQRNMSRFREGDMLLLNRGDPLEEPRALCTLEVDDETRLIVSIDEPGVNWGRILHQRTGWVLDQGDIDLSQHVLDALDQVAKTTIGQQRILPLLMGRVEPTIDYARYERAYRRAEEWGLNEAQCEAVANAYATNLTWLIQGPPGTGKTLALARLVQLLVEDGERVLVTALTHRAINNALEKIAYLNQRGDAGPISFCKIGRRARAEGLRGVENYETFDQSPFTELSGGYAIGATLFATRTDRLSGVDFDTVIFDEASQITMPLAIMGMLVAKRYIFIGDHKQLPPVLTAKHREAWLRSSVFGALVGRRFDTMLDETYRMNAELTAWPSQQHYYGKLRCATETIARRRIVYRRPPTRCIDILDPETPKVFVDLRHRNTTTRSHEEANLICHLIAELLRCGVEPAEIGVVAPYRAQGRLIRNLLRSVIPDNDRRRALVVDTVERMQGQERDVVFLSLTTSNPAFAAGIADFFLQPERLNVAVTRARVKLIIVGSRHLLATAPENWEYRALIEQLKDLISSCAYRLAPHVR